MEEKGVSTFLLFTRNGVTQGAKQEILKQLYYQRYIIVIEEENLKEINKKKLPIELLKEKVKELENQLESEQI